MIITSLAMTSTMVFTPESNSRACLTMTVNPCDRHQPPATSTEKKLEGAGGGAGGGESCFNR